MKKISTRSVFAAVLIVASLGSYLYLQNVSNYVGEPQEMIQESTAEEATGAATPEIILPDVQLLKKVVETGKRFIPAN